METVQRTHHCGELTREVVGRQVVLNGWVQKRRDLGGLIFIDLRDRSGVVQVVCNPEISPEAAAAADRAPDCRLVPCATTRNRPSTTPPLRRRRGTARLGTAGFGGKVAASRKGRSIRTGSAARAKRVASHIGPGAEVARMGRRL